MVKSRTGTKIIFHRSKIKLVFIFVNFFLQFLGRLTYKSIFFAFVLLFSLIRIIFKLNVLIINKLFSFNKIYLFLLFFIFLAYFFYFNFLKGLPHPSRLLLHQPILSTRIYDRNHNLLATIYDGSHKRTLVKLEDIPPFLIQATISIEDKDFFQHHGFSITAILRAIFNNLLKEKKEGGSTITQQLVKNTLLTPEKTLKRKIKEIILSIQTEFLFSKKEILQMYLNEAPYGGTAYGVEEASQTYFGKSVKNISLAEAALLAGLPAAPSRYSPFGSHPQEALKRQHLVLDKMVEQGYISKEQAQEAKKEKIVLTPFKDKFFAPHFVMYVKNILTEKYGSRVVEQGGLQVETSLDLELQKKSEAIVFQELEKAKELNIGNGAVLIINPQTGEILAMVGSKNYYNLLDGKVNLTTALRQPGSAIKPITYALALKEGLTAATIIPDTPITFHLPNQQSYSPQNYDRQFHGLVSLRTALASSYNVPAVKILSYLGVENLIAFAKNLGISTWTDPQKYGLSLTLGGGEITMMDLAKAYAVFANNGFKIELNPILKITDSQGKTLEKISLTKEKVLDERIAFIINDILSDNSARTPAFGPDSLLNFPLHQVAVKTGTTDEKRDNWTIGYTSDFLVAVWVGNNDNSPMANVISGLSGAAPIWHKIMAEHLQNKKEAHRFSPPEGLTKISICSVNGLLPCSACPSLKEEYFIADTEPKQSCDNKILEPNEKKEENRILEGTSTKR